MNGPNMTQGMRPPMFGGGVPPHMQPGMNLSGGSQMDSHMAAILRQQMFQQQMQQQQMNPYGGGISPHLRNIPQQSPQQPSPSFNGLSNGGAGPMQPGTNMQQWLPNMMQMNGQPNGHPRGFDNQSMDMQNGKFFKLLWQILYV